jgi:hypothetical protein
VSPVTAQLMRAAGNLPPERSRGDRGFHRKYPTSFFVKKSWSIDIQFGSNEMCIDSQSFQARAARNCPECRSWHAAPLKTLPRGVRKYLSLILVDQQTYPMQSGRWAG